MIRRPCLEILRSRNYCCPMPRHMYLNASPPVYTGSREFLDKDVFHKTIPVLAARVPATKTRILLKAEPLRKFLMDLPKIRTVVPIPNDPQGQGDRLVLLRTSQKSDLSLEAREFLEKESSELVAYDVKLNYDYWTADEILNELLPEELREGSPTGFAMIGHIAHVNLNDDYLPFKHIIGQLILDKNKRVTTVVNKLKTIDNQFRVFKMELIAGEPNYIVEHHESDCRFIFDFSQVYWNSRLHTEHERLVQLFEPEDVIADVFAGVGPFAIPAAKKGCGVLANDLNPNSAAYLSKNVQNNRVDNLVHVSCEDGLEFIRAVVGRLFDSPFPAYAGPALSRVQQERERRKAQKLVTETYIDHTAASSNEENHRKRISHFVMNLPDSAIQFLSAFRGILNDPKRDLSGVYDVLPMVHCHCFTRELDRENADKDIRKRVEEELGYPLKADVSLHFVRSVAPNKDMYCISFRLPHEVAYSL